MIRVEVDEEALARFVDERIGAALAAHSALGWIRRDKSGVELRTLNSWIRSGEVASSRIGRQIMVRVADVAKAIEARRADVRADVHDGEPDEVDAALQRRRLRLVGRP